MQVEIAPSYIKNSILWKAAEMQLNDIAGQVQIVSNWSEIVSETAV